MRLCRASCVGVALAFVLMAGAGSALAARGGEHGKGQGHAWAKGHAKTKAPAGPGLQVEAHPAAGAAGVAPPVRVQVPAKAKEAKAGRTDPPGAFRRHNHLSICHATGSGRYVVISPDIAGAEHHLAGHDDFVFRGSCERTTSVEPPPKGAPMDPPHDPPAAHVLPEVAHGQVALRVRARELPFTGLPLWIPLLVGAASLGGGLALRRQARGQIS